MSAHALPRTDPDGIIQQHINRTPAAPTGEEAETPKFEHRGWPATRATSLAVSAFTGNTKLILGRVRNGEAIELTQRGAAVAVLVPRKQYDRLTAQATELAALGEDKAVLDWLEENISYVMLGANYEAARPVAGLLLNNGTGWRDGELRKAVRVMLERDATRRGNEAR